ncbi:TraB/GumN family protein [Xanthomonadaceae bacterium XH05]|nr:TraB/GumN family protein [Xanthomonadaceae bacterium XH05]
MKHWFLTAFLAVAGIAATHAAPPTPLLWKAQGDAGTVYLLGSFHLLTADDYPLHPQVEHAYLQAGELVFEIDPAEMAAPETMGAIQRLAKFDDGRTLRQVVSKETAEKLQAFMGGSDAAMAGADPFKPWFMGMNLAVGAMASIGLNPQLGLDQHFMQRAAKDGKPVSGLETALDQMGALDRAPMNEQEQMLAEALIPAAESRDKIMDLHRLWRSGDEAGLLETINGEMAQKTPQMYALLNRDRNNAWLPQVVAMLDERGTRLVVVGAMHLIGEDGLVALLRARGAKVERVDIEVIPLEALDEAA